MRISDWSSDVCSSDLRLGYTIVPKWQQATETWGGLTRLPIKTVLDIGALRGEFATDILAPAFPGATIHCFEPSPDAFPLLATAASRSNERIVAHNFGLGEEEAELKFFVNVDRSEEHTSELQSLMRRSY